MEELYLSENGINVIEGIENNAKLTTLDLAYNKISTIPSLSYVPELQDLWVNYHLRIPYYYLLFEKNYNFRIILQLNNNEITSWKDVDNLNANKKLETLYLEHNPLANTADYRRKVKLALPQLTQLDATLLRFL